jgi:hypothetical protein
MIEQLAKDVLFKDVSDIDHCSLLPVSFGKVDAQLINLQNNHLLQEYVYHQKNKQQG